MKKLFLLLFLFFALTSFKKYSVIQSPNVLFVSDTIKQPHVIDGIISEWPEDKFTADKETDISYAFDNDASQLYVALKITNQQTQFRIMRLGMDFFIDVKGKHKENTYIEFPIKGTPDFNSGGGGGGRRQSDDNNGGTPRTFDPQQVRQQFASKLLTMKLSGFEGQSDDMTVGIYNENGINISFSWDDANVMYIEYGIPIKSIGTVAGLTGKKISVGIRLNAPASTNFGSTSEAVVPASTVGARGGIPRSATSSTNNAGSKFAMQEINIWSKYDMKF